MSRLERHKQKQSVYRFLLIGVLVFGFLFLSFTYGFQLIVNGTLFINQLANSVHKKEVPEEKDKILTSLIIDPPPPATNSAQIILSGETVNFDLVEIYLNNEKMTDAPVKDDVFSEEISGLEKGENAIHFIAKSSDNRQTKRSITYTVVYKNEKPKLEITEPSDNTKTSKQEIKIAGKTEKEVYIRINGQPVVVDASGTFQQTVKLSDGDNTIEVVAEDVVGNTETKNLKITYAKDD